MVILEYDYPIRLGMDNASNDLIGVGNGWVTRFTDDTNFAITSRAIEYFQGPMSAPFFHVEIKLRGKQRMIFFRKMFMVTGTSNLFPGLYLKTSISGDDKLECDGIDNDIHDLIRFFITGVMEVDYIKSTSKGTFDIPFISKLKIRTFEILDLQTNNHHIVLQA